MKTNAIYAAQLFAVALLLSGCAANVSTAGSPTWPAGVLPSRVARPDYAFSCDPAQFHNQTVVTVTPGVKQAVPPNFQAKADVTYYPVAGFCGVSNSFLSNDQVYLRNEYTRKNTVVHPFIDILSSGWWVGKPDIAVWEEAWYGNIFRTPADDVHLSLIRVQ